MVARIQMNTVDRINVFITIIVLSMIMISIFAVNIMAVNRLIPRILVYSAIKIKAKRPLLYSTLNPETSSDSPSAKSNGVRFVSARFVMNHRINIGNIINISHERCELAMCVRSKDDRTIKAHSRINVILTSYEIVWATPRRAPSNAYFELEHQPAINVAYTCILETHRKYRIPNLIKNDWLWCGYKTHTNNDSVSLRTGANINGIRLDIVGFACSFTNSLIASAKGTGRPRIPGLLGPFRVWK